MFGAAPPAGGGLFGAAAPAPAGGGLFGAPAASAPAAGGLFGAPATSAPAAGGLFGAPATSAPAAGGLFGAPAAAPAAGGLFGAPAAATAPAAGGLFGAATSPAAAPAGGLFGAATSAPAAGGLFGAAASPLGGAAPGGLFGAQPTGGLVPAQGAQIAPAQSTENIHTWTMKMLRSHPSVEIQQIEQELKQMRSILDTIHQPGKDVTVDGGKLENVGKKIDSARAECKGLHRECMQLKANYQRDRNSVTQLEKHIGGDLKHVHSARHVWEQIRNRQPISNDVHFPSMFFHDLQQYYQEQMHACRAKIEELDHSLRVKDERGSKALTVLQDIMQSHYQYLWSVAESIKTQLDAISEEKYHFEHHVCADAARRFEDAEKMMQRMDGNVLALEAQLGMPQGAVNLGALQPAAGTGAAGTLMAGPAPAAAPVGGLFGAQPAAAPAAPAPAAAGGLFGAPAAAAAPAPAGGLFGAQPAAAPAGGLFGGAAAGGAPAIGATPSTPKQNKRNSKNRKG